MACALLTGREGEGKFIRQALVVLRGKRKRRKKKNQSAQKIRGTATTGHLEEVRRTGIIPGAPCQGVSRAEGPTEAAEQATGAWEGAASARSFLLGAQCGGGKTRLANRVNINTNVSPVGPGLGKGDGSCRTWGERRRQGQRDSRGAGSGDAGWVVFSSSCCTLYCISWSGPNTNPVKGVGKK